MIVYLLIAISLAIWIMFVVNESSYWGFSFGDFIMGGVFAVVSFVVMVGIVLLISIFPHSELVKVETNSITALKDNGKTNGSFFLGSGNIGEDQYCFYIEETDKGKKMNKVIIDNGYIKEESVKPYVDKYETHYTSKLVKWLFGENKPLGSDEYVFHVPKNTVTTDFNVDMK